MNGFDFIGHTPSNWPVKKIAWLFDLIGSGTTPDTGKPEFYDDGTISWVNTAELRDGVIENTQKRVTEDAARQFSALTIFPRGTLLIALYGATIGRLGILDMDATTNQACCGLAHPKGVDTRFVYYWLLSQREHLIMLGSGGGQPNISQEIIKQLRLAVPPLDEQRHIAAALDRETARLDELRLEKERFLELLERKRAALIAHAVTGRLYLIKARNDQATRFKASGVEWLGDVPEHWEVVRSRWLFKERDERSVSGEEELLTVSHLTGVTTRAEKENEVNMFKAETLEGYKLCWPGDLAINTMWAWMGAMGTVRQAGLVSPSYNVYEPSPCYLPQYVDYLSRTPAFIAEVTSRSKGVWSSRLRLYPDAFFQIHFPVPPLDEQRVIVAHLERILKKMDALKEALLDSLGLLAQRRAALIAAAVTGHLTLNA